MKLLLVILIGLSFDSSAISMNSVQAVKTSYLINLDSVLGVGVETSIDDRFGHVLEKGDFNGDGYEDLAIGIPFFDFFTLDDVGAVLVVMGSHEGLQLTGGSDNQLLFQNTDPLQDGIEEDDKFGWALTAGDFNNDGFDDLVVGVPFEDVFQVGILNAGGINIFTGSAGGLIETSEFIHQGSGVASDSFVEAIDQFGFVLETGDFNDDGFADLVVGVPLEDLGDVIDNQGQINVYYGGPDGIDPDDQERVNQNSVNIDGNAEAGDFFGSSLASGDFNDDGIDDLAVGVPGQDLNGEVDAGQVHIFSGTTVSGVSASDYLRSQEGPVNGIVEAGDELGNALSAGDINGDGIDDLVIGVWKEDANSSGLVDSGGINVLFGAIGGLSEVDDQFIAQNNSAVEGDGVDLDQFGGEVLVADVNYDGFADVIVGTPNDLFGGGVNILYGSAAGVSLLNDEYELANNAGDDFSHSMIVGRFGPFVEMVIGAPGWESDDGDAEAGTVEVYSFTKPDLIFKDGFAGLPL